MQSSAVGENVITDLRTILEDALERVKSEIFRPGSGPGHEEAEGKGPGTAGTADSTAGSPDDASADASVADDTPPAGDAGKG
jgi:hypothetical protein